MEIKQINRDNFLQVQRNGPLWNNERGLYDDRYSGKGYISTLPKFNGANLLNLLEKKGKTPGGAAVVDSGCGPYAKFLLDCSALGSKGIHVRGIGIDACIHLTLEQRKNYENNNIALIEGDVQELAEVLNGIQADLITANYVLPYVATPWETIVQIWQSLCQDGIALTNWVPLSPVIPELENDKRLLDAFVSYLKRIGMNVDMRETRWRNRRHTECHLSWQNRTGPVELPLVNTDGIIHQQIQIDDGDSFSFVTAEYRVNRDLLRN